MSQYLLLLVECFAKSCMGIIPCVDEVGDTVVCFPVQVATDRLVVEESDKNVPIAELVERPVPVGAQMDVVFEVPYGGINAELGKILVDEEMERKVPMAELVEPP